MGIDILLKNERARAHLLYGNLLSVDQRRQWAQRDAAAGNRKAVLEEIERDVGKPKEALLQAAIEKHLTPKMKELQDTILGDFEERYPALQQFVYEMTNEELGHEEFYLPIEVIEGKSKETQDEVKEALRIGSTKFNLSPEKGFTIDKKDIPLWEESAVTLDILKMHSKGAEREEHLIAYGELVRHLNAVHSKRRGADKTSAYNAVRVSAHIIIPIGARATPLYKCSGTFRCHCAPPALETFTMSASHVPSFVFVPCGFVFILIVCVALCGGVAPPLVKFCGVRYNELWLSRLMGRPAQEKVHLLNCWRSGSVLYTSTRAVFTER
jgi:hypothetical protein